MHPELLKLTVQACRDYMAAGDCHGEAPPSERLIAAVVQLREQLDAADEQIAQLARALREAVEPPTFMGEPVPHPANRAARIAMDPQRLRELAAAAGVMAAPAPADKLAEFRARTPSLRRDDMPGGAT